MGWYFQVKLRSNLPECIPEQAVLKKAVCCGVCVLKFVRMYSFTGALKTPILSLWTWFQTKLK